MKKNYLLYIILLTFSTSLWIGCDDYKDAEAIDFFQPVSDEYYEALRAYKKTDHQVSFGWFGNWSGEGASLKNCLIGLPDSVDFVSLWGNWINTTPAQKEDLELCRNLKGTRFTCCFIVSNIGSGPTTPSEVSQNWEANGFPSQEAAVKDYWGWVDGDDAKIEAAIRKYAKAIVDTVYKYNYDGFDIDYEPNYGAAGNMASYRNRMFWFVDELGKYLGPKSGTGKLLVVDGEPQSMPAESGPYFDWFIIQAYKCTGDANLNSRLSGLVRNYDGVMSAEEVTRKLIMTENFEAVDAAQAGGYNYTDQYGNKMMSLDGMARWQPNNGFRKGGVGTYHMEAEYSTNPEYKHLRNAIQIMNPSSNTLIKY